jgi:hypothetical protein
MRGAGAVARPSREFAPAGDLLFVPPKSRQKAPPGRAALRFAAGSLRCSGLEGSRGTRFATLRSDNRAKSVVEACCARALKAFRCSAALKGVRRNTSNARPARLAFWLFGCSGSPLQNRREAQQPRARAKRASTSDFAPLCLSVVSAANEASWARPWVATHRGRTEGSACALHDAGRGTCRLQAARHAGDPPIGWAVLQGSFFAYFLSTQKVGRPPGRIPGWASRHNQKQRQAHQARKQ